MLQRIRSFLRRVKLALTVLWKGLPKEDREADKAVAEVLLRHRKPGLPCPRCGVLIVVDIPALLAKSYVVCSGCGLRLKIDWNDDARARRALEEVMFASEVVEHAKTFRGP